MGLIPGSGRSPGGGNDNLLQYSYLENLTGLGAWGAAVQDIAKSWTQLSYWAHNNASKINPPFHVCSFFGRQLCSPLYHQRTLVCVLSLFLHVCVRMSYLPVSSRLGCRVLKRSKTRCIHSWARHHAKCGYKINGQLHHSISILMLEAYKSKGAFSKNHGTENKANRFVRGLDVSSRKSLQSCPTLCDPRGYSSPGSSVHGVS